MDPKLGGFFIEACGIQQLAKVPIQTQNHMIDISLAMGLRLRGFLCCKFKYTKRDSMKDPEQSQFCLEITVNYKKKKAHIATKQEPQIQTCLVHSGRCCLGEGLTQESRCREQCSPGAARPREIRMRWCLVLRLSELKKGFGLDCSITKLWDLGFTA